MQAGSFSYYQQSNLISDEANKSINKLNSNIEITLTVFIFISSFLVLSIEKYWWGGYLSWNDSSEDRMMVSSIMSGIHHIKHHIKKTDIYLQYEHEFYVINNMIRLTIVGSSIAFFMILSLLDVI